MTQYKQTSIHVWHLQMTENPTLKENAAKQSTDSTITPTYELRQCQRPVPELNRFLYATVGGPWKWYMRLKWTWQQWSDFLDRPEIHTWIAFQGATPIGYFELEEKKLAGGTETEIVYFGLLPEFVGKGFGKPFLEDAISKAWELATKRIWLHTCTLDHDNALPNYLNRGFEIFKEEDFVDNVPQGPLDPWPGAEKPSI